MHLRIGLSSVPLSRPRAAVKKTISLVALFGAVLGCESVPDKTDGGVPVPADALMIADANNYSVTDENNSLMPPVIETAPGDLDIYWDDLMVDMQCHPLNPSADIGMVSLLRFLGPDHEEAAELLTSGYLEMMDLGGYSDFETDGVTQCKLSDLTNFGTPVNIDEQYAEDENRAYMIVWSNGTVPGRGARAMAFLRPVEGNPNTVVRAEDACGILTFEPVFGQPLAVEAGQTVLAWNNMKTDVLGNDLAKPLIDRVLLARYETETADDLAAGIFDLERNAEDMWEVMIDEETRNVDLTNMRHLDANLMPEEDDTFEGFDSHPGTTTWLFGLLCTTCQNPAPLVLTELVPE